MSLKKTITLFLFLGLAPLTARAQVEIDPLFNPNLILNDADILNCDSMSLTEIQNFLKTKGSYLANYSTLNAHGTTKTAAEIIYDAARNNYDCADATLSDSPTELEKQQKCRRINTINPKFLLVLLQKEASLVEDGNPTADRLNWATGYGCPDGWVCNPYYKGFGKQVNSAALQFLSYMNETNNYTYRPGQTYTFTNPYGTISQEPISVTPQNKATAALYNYTPHVFNGNYNVYKLWNRYFPKAAAVLYPDGALLQVKDDPGIWLIENGKKRPFLNYAAFASRFKTDQVIQINKEDLDNYIPGEAIKFSNYSLVQTPDKKIYLLVNKEKRPFVSTAVFKKIGFNAAELEEATEADLTDYQLGKAITATSTYVTGALLQDIKTGGVFYVENGTKAPLIDKILLTTKFKDKKIIKVSAKILDAYQKIDPILFGDGTLLKTNNSSVVYLISNGQKRAFSDEAIFNKLAYNFKNIITVSSQFLYNYPLGETIK
jgi:hypothetical protein